MRRGEEDRLKHVGVEVHARTLQVVLPLNIPLKIAMPTDVALVDPVPHSASSARSCAVSAFRSPNTGSRQRIQDPAGESELGGDLQDPEEDGGFNEDPAPVVTRPIEQRRAPTRNGL